MFVFISGSLGKPYLHIFLHVTSLLCQAVLNDVKGTLNMCKDKNFLWVSVISCLKKGGGGGGGSSALQIFSVCIQMPGAVRTTANLKESL
jgi:hypothetical protein